MADTREKLPWRIFFLFICLLAAGDLVVGSFFLWSGKPLPNAGKSIHTISNIPGHISKFAAGLTDFKSFIAPSSDDKLAVITPIEAAPVAKTIPATSTSAPAVLATSTAASPAPAPAPAPPPRVAAANLYAWGNCTWWASARRAQVNDPIPNSWGNAATWAYRASQDGYIVNHTPSPGAIMQTGGGLGHVAFVESVDNDGSWHISEMNVIGLNVVDHVTRSVGEASNYNFIHDVASQ
jgi:surface antigen